MPITYTIAVDLNDDGDFVDTNEVLNTDVLSAQWRLGMAAPYDTVSAPAEAHITLRNTSKQYSPEASGALALLPGKRLRITSYDGTTTRTQFTGIVERVEPLTGTLSQRTVIIHASGGEKQLAQTSARLPPQVNVRADVTLNAILDQVPLRRTVLKGYAILNLVGHAELGTNTLLAGVVSRITDTAKSTFAYAGDTWGSGIAADDAVRQLVEGERGRFFFNRDNDPVFYNRHNTLLNTTSAATFDNTADQLEYSYARDLANRVRVTITPRSVGSAASILWEVDSPQRVNAVSRREIVARYRDADKRSIGALTVLHPVPGVDFAANTAADGTGIDMTAQVSVTLLRADFSAATLDVRNDSGVAVYLLTGMQLRGTPLYRDDPLTIEQTDWTSVTLYGLRTLDFALPALSSADEAEQTARYELARRSTPRGVLRSINLSNLKHTAHILARTLFDRITVKDTQTEHDADYFIIAEQHQVDRGGTRHRTTWLLEPASANRFAKLNTAELDQGYALAY